MKAADVAAITFTASVSLFFLAFVTGNFVVYATQPNGLAEVLVPYEMISFLAFLAAFWVLIFGLILSGTILLQGTNPTGGMVLGSGLVAGGALTSLRSRYWLTGWTKGLAALVDAPFPCYNITRKSMWHPPSSWLWVS
jgi:hypothetical protein